jgi:hypothetical protein
MQQPQANGASMQMAAQRQAFMGMGPQGPTPNTLPGTTLGLGKKGLSNFGGMAGGMSDAVHALDSGGSGHMI